MAAEKFVPMIMGVGASSGQMVRRGDLSVCVITQYADEATALSAQQKILIFALRQPHSFQ